LVSSFKELIERELRIAQGTIICAQNLLTQKFLLILQEGHIMYSTHGELLFAK
jgi:hypothetical protein